MSLTACALNGHNNTFLDCCKSEGLISLIWALNSPPAPTAALFLVLSSLPSYTVSWKHKSGAHTVPVWTGWCKRGCFSSCKLTRAAGKRRSVLTQRPRYNQTPATEPPNIPNVGLCICFCSINTVSGGGSQLDILFSGPKWAASVGVPLSVLLLYLLLCIQSKKEIGRAHV